MFKLFVCILLLYAINLNAQLSAEAGDNLYLCTKGDSFELAPLGIHRINSNLGGNPTAKGGLPPYKYKWECSIKTNLSSKPYIYASDILNDTSIANPTLKNKFGLNDAYLKNKFIKFSIVVTDSIGDTSYDSVYIAQSSYIYSMISSIGKKVSDTILLPNVANGGVYSGYTIWSPTTYLIDTNRPGTRTFTPYEITYNGFRIDSLGCKSSTFNIQIDFILSSILVPESAKFIKNYHNPIYESSIFELSNINKINYIEIYNFEGQKIYSQNSTDKLEIGRLTKEKGFYFILFYDKENKMKSIQVQKE